MSLNSHLIHSCVVERPGDTGAVLNTYGNDRPQWVQVDGGQAQPCRLVIKEQRIWSDEKAESAVATVYALILSAEADIQERDRIARVTLEDGSVFPHAFTVSEILPRRRGALHHITAKLSRTS